MLSDIISKFAQSQEKYVVIRILTNMGPTKLERWVREEVPAEDLRNLWSGVLDFGAIIFRCCNKNIVILWKASSTHKIVEVKATDSFNIEEMEEAISSGGIMSSVIRIMRESY